MEERFWKKVEMIPFHTCWEWTACIRPDGYGSFRKPGWKGGTILAHRYSYALHFGSIQNDLCVCHKCDNRSCVRPDHLFLGTYMDNIHDMIKKGRDCRGTMSHRAKISEKDVVEIRRRYTLGENGPDLGKAFGVTKSQIYSIVKRVNWKHIS